MSWLASGIEPKVLKHRLDGHIPEPDKSLLDVLVYLVKRLEVEVSDWSADGHLHRDVGLDTACDVQTW